MGVTRKQSTSNFPKTKHFLPPDTHIHDLKAEKCAILAFSRLNPTEKTVYLEIDDIGALYPFFTHCCHWVKMDGTLHKLW